MGFREQKRNENNDEFNAFIIFNESTILKLYAEFEVVLYRNVHVDILMKSTEWESVLCAVCRDTERLSGTAAHSIRQVSSLHPVKNF